MSKKIIIISKEFKTYWNVNSVDVDSKFYDEEMNPIISNGGVNMDKEPYHLGQISSSFGRAKHDMSYERYKDHFDKLYPEANGDFEFEFQAIPLNVIDKENVYGLDFGKGNSQQGEIIMEKDIIKIHKAIENAIQIKEHIVEFCKSKEKAMEQNIKIDRNYLHEMYNATSVSTGIDGVETYVSWLERQLISRIQKEKEKETNNSKPCFVEWLESFNISESGKYIFNDNHYSKLAMLEIYNGIYNKN